MSTEEQVGYDVYNGLNYINGPVYSVWFPLKLALFFFFFFLHNKKNLKKQKLKPKTEVPQ